MEIRIGQVWKNAVNAQVEITGVEENRVTSVLLNSNDTIIQSKHIKRFLKEFSHDESATMKKMMEHHGKMIS